MIMELYNIVQLTEEMEVMIIPITEAIKRTVMEAMVIWHFSAAHLMEELVVP